MGVQLISAGAIAANLILNTGGFTANADKALQRGVMLEGRMRSLTDRVGALGRSFTIMSIGLGLASKRMAGAFINAADVTERLSLVMQTVTRDGEEANKMFSDMTEFAATVPFELEEIITAATKMTAIFKGDTNFVRAWMVPFADLAAISEAIGLNFRDISNQFTKLISRGPGATDLFRDNGILDMLGIDPKAKLPLEDVRKQVFEALTDPLGNFKGAAQALSTTFGGIVSMIRDQWFILRNEIMNTGLFDTLKDDLRSFLTALTASRPRIVAFVADHQRLVTQVVMGTAAFLAAATAMVIMGFTIPPIVHSLGLLGAGFKVATSALKGFLVWVGVAEAVALPAAAGFLAISAAILGIGFAVRALSNQRTDFFEALLGPALPALQSLWDATKWFFTQILTGVEVLGNAIVHIVATFVSAIGDLINTASDFLNLGVHIDTTQMKETIQLIDEWRRGGLQPGQSPIANTGRAMGESLKENMGQAWQDVKEVGTFTWGSMVDQFKVDLSGLTDYITTKFPVVQQFMDLFKGNDANAGESIRKAISESLSANRPDFGAHIFQSEQDRAAAKRAQRAKEALEARGEKRFRKLTPVNDMVHQITVAVTELTAAGHDTDAVFQRMRQSMVETFGDDLTITQMGLVEAMLVKHGQAALDAGFGIKAMQQAILDQEYADKTLEMLQNLDPMVGLVADINEEYARFNEFLKANADITSDPANLLAGNILQNAGAQTVAEIDSIIATMTKLTPAVKKAMEAIRDVVKKADDKKNFKKSISNTKKLGQSISGLGPKFQAVGTAVQVVGQVMELATTIMTLGWKEVLSAVFEIVAALGILGGDTEESMSAMDNLMEDLASTMEEVGDRMTDAIVQFAKTGKAEIGELADFILEEFFRAGISNLVIDPALSFIGGAFGFKDGGAFRDGHLTKGPEMFAYRSGLGVRGEAGTEAVLPLATIGGKLGVNASGGGGHTTVNIIGADPSEVVVTEETVNGETIIEVVLDHMKSAMMGGEFDDAMALSGRR